MPGCFFSLVCHRKKIITNQATTSWSGWPGTSCTCITKCSEYAFALSAVVKKKQPLPPMTSTCNTGHFGPAHTSALVLAIKGPGGGGWFFFLHHHSFTFFFIHMPFLLCSIFTIIFFSNQKYISAAI